MKRIVLLATLALGGAVAAPAAGQQTPRTTQTNPPAMTPTNVPGGMQGMAAMGGMAMQRDMMGGMGMQGMMAPSGPQDVLAMAQALGLTDAQVQKLRAIAEQAHAAAQPHAQAAMQAHHAAMQALDSDSPDLATFEARLREAATHQVEAQVAAARAATQALAVLTPEQRSNVRFALRLQHARAMQGMMMGGSPDMTKRDSTPAMKHDMH